MSVWGEEARLGWNGFLGLGFEMQWGGERGRNRKGREGKGRRGQAGGMDAENPKKSGGRYEGHYEVGEGDVRGEAGEI